MKRIVMTGGGTAGHVTVNLALIPHLLSENWDIHYIGGYTGIERTLIEAIPQVTYHGISVGKLRRYFDIKNMSDPFRVLHGSLQATMLLRRLKPSLVFAKGGFVSVPVAVGGYLNRVPVLLHESDLSMGLANRLCAPMAKAILTTFPEAAARLAKGVQTGTPLRADLFAGTRENGLTLCGFDGKKPVLMVTGGSSGAVAVNDLVRALLPQLTKDFDVLHLCGQGNLDPALENVPGYRQFAYLHDQLPHAFAAADILISRAGSTTLSEIIALHKPALLIPYPTGSSRGDQIENAQSMEKRGLAKMLLQQEATSEALLAQLRALWQAREEYLARLREVPNGDGTEAVLAQIRRYAKG